MVGTPIETKMIVKRTIMADNRMNISLAVLLMDSSTYFGDLGSV